MNRLNLWKLTNYKTHTDFEVDHNSMQINMHTNTRHRSLMFCRRQGDFIQMGLQSSLTILCYQSTKKL